MSLAGTFLDIYICKIEYFLSKKFKLILKLLLIHNIA